MKEEARFTIDMRPVQMERRDVRDGNALLMQSRSGRVNAGGDVEWCEWWTCSTITNYGDCFDEKPSLLQRLFGVNT